MAITRALRAHTPAGIFRSTLNLCAWLKCCFNSPGDVSRKKERGRYELLLSNYLYFVIAYYFGSMGLQISVTQWIRIASSQTVQDIMNISTILTFSYDLAI